MFDPIPLGQIVDVWDRLDDPGRARLLRAAELLCEEFADRPQWVDPTVDGPVLGLLDPGEDVRRRR